MAETYGTETHEHEDEYGEHQHEQDAVNEAPSDYEFSDDSGATADVEHNEEILSSEEKSPRRSPVMPIIAVVGGVLLLGGVAWWQFGSHSSATMPFAGSTPVPIATVPPPPVTTERKPGPPAVKVSDTDHTPALAVDPRVASATPQMQITDQSSTAALPSGSVAPAKNDLPAPVAPTPTPVPLPAPVAVVAPAAPATAAVPPFAIPTAPPQHAAAAPAPSPSPSPLSLVAQPAVPTPASTTPVPAAAPTTSDKAQIDALNQHINELQAKLDHVNEQLSQVMNMVAATANTSHASATAQDQANKVAAEVSTFHQMPTRHPSSPRAAALAAQTTPSMQPEEAPSEEAAAAEPAQRHHTAKHKRTHTTPTRKPAEPAEAKAQQSRQTWILRAATPGHAWVATSADSRDLKAIQVGDTVTGIGQVTAIHQQGNSWVVQGTHGNIH